MMLALPWWLFLACGVAAAVYASVGLGGGTAYVAFLALAGAAPEPLRVGVLILNVVPATLAFFSYARAGHLRRELLAPFLSTSIPAAFAGGLLRLPARPFEMILGATLLVIACHMLLWSENRVRPRPIDLRTAWRIGPPVGLLAGGLAGIVSVGGGVFLAPILIVAGWATSKQAAPVAAAFVVLNSLAGLVGHGVRGNWPAAWLWPLLAVVVGGGLVGARLGAGRLSSVVVRRVFGWIALIVALQLGWRALGSGL
jgi:uncharacterized membrane protein YfcA